MKKKFLYLLLIIAVSWSCEKKVKKDVVDEILQKPNIVFIMADDHAIQAISAYGNELSKYAPTPNIDRIAKNGAIFNRSYCTNSICGPSRAVILTGKHSHINGFRQNDEKFNGYQQTLPKILQKSGYQTAIIGKWHLFGYPQGFDYWEILNDQGNYYNPEFIRMADTVNIDDSRVNVSADKPVDIKDTITVNGYATDIITHKAINWLKNQKNQNQPFFLMVHHKAPHRNWMPAPRHLNKYDSVKFPLPDTYFDKHNNQQAAKEQMQTIYKDMYEGHDLKMTKSYGSTELAHNPWTKDFDRMTPEQRKIWDSAYQAKNKAFHKANLHGEDLARWKGQRFLQDYLATVASVDEGVGEILDYLEKTGLDENTLVIYTSDQGFYLGEKGWFDKRFMYEESFRMPLLMQYPKSIKPGTQVNALIQNLDFAPTMLDFANAGEYAKNMQGISFKPVLDGKIKDDDFKDVIYYHYYDFPSFHMVKKHYGIRTKKYKIMHFYDDNDAWEFYDMEADPYELNNLIDSQEYESVIISMKRKLDSVQKVYGVIEKEFERAPKEKVEKTYEYFEKLRGTPVK
ncbi:sulfatase family protein [Abyssalbus ytuae]|uniref:Sulfatase n=1 Tax=Abyssalbus ytuae TaxID=2926907 RepID=A0A9E6ZIF3_9FLAO|nr:sulfatase [Abyssalbus ytuae]UOB16112.1 sulfatase [Abyssalbus ytuae]